jgi:hypothetical protein
MAGTTNRVEIFSNIEGTFIRRIHEVNIGVGVFVSIMRVLGTPLGLMLFLITRKYRLQYNDLGGNSDFTSEENLPIATRRYSIFNCVKKNWSRKHNRKADVNLLHRDTKW